MKVAIVYPFLAHYREGIFSLLSRQKEPLPRYLFVSGPDSGKFLIKTIDIRKADLPKECGGLEWRVVRNYWLGPLLWQTKVFQLAFQADIGAVVFLGNPYFISTWVTSIACKLRKKRILMWTHGFLRGEKTPLETVRRVFYKLADGLLLYGNRAAQICKNTGFHPSKLYVIFNSLDYDSQVAVRNRITEQERMNFKKKHFVEHNLPLIVSVCRLTSRKRLDMIVKVVRELHKKGTRVNAMFVGNGPVRSYLQDLVKKFNLTQNIKFFGECYDERELGLVFSSADLCVMPGEVGLTCIHALTYGTPVITHNRPDLQMPEFEAIIPGKTGDLFQYNDLEDMERKILRWISTSTSREKVRLACQSMVDNIFNPNFQARVINSAVLGLPADLCPSRKTAYKPLFKSSLK